jgi:hypothetical protein
MSLFNMDKVKRYHELAEEMRSRSCLATDPATRKQLQIAAHDLEVMAQEAEDETEGVNGS